MKLEEKFLSSSAIGDKNLYMWATQGRLRVDVMFYICRSTPLPSYKLDEVTKTYMSGGLVGVERVERSGEGAEGSEELLLQVKGSWGDARPGRYVCLLDETGESLTEKMPILAHKKGEVRVRWVGRPEDDIEDEAWKDATQWVIVKDDVSPAELFKLHTGSSADRARVAAYCVQDCDLVLDLYYKLEIFNTSMSMANVCTVPVSYIFTRGQGIKIESLMFKEAYRRGQAVHVLPAPANRGAATGRGEDKYEGAIVLEPTVGLLGAPVGVADFASLYPSTIVSENISHDTLVWVKDYDHKGNYMKTAWTCGDSANYDLPAEIPFTDIEFDLLQADPTDTRKDPRKLSVGKRICRYAQDAKGTVPQIIEGLLAARKATRALIPKETDPLKISLLDAQQNAYKITANSLYGQLGSKTFKLRLQHLAASVTGYGRKQIMFAKAVIERFYGPKSGNSFCRSSVVYGDTDSLFVQFNPLNPETGEALTGRESRIATIELTGEAGHLVSQVLKAPHDFEFDKVYDPLLMFSKKLYAGRMFENEKKPDDFVYKYMGISIKRRGNAPLVKTVYGAAMNTVLEKRDVVGAAEIVLRGVQDLVEGRTKMGQLIITKSLKAEYACTPPAHRVLADRIKARDPGNAPAAGDRLPYVYVRPGVGQVAAKLQGERIETPQYVRDKGLVVDYEYYIQHQLKNPISQMFGILLEQMPGYSPGLLPDGWRNLDEDKRVAMRENVAAKLLFGDALVRIAEDSKRAFVAAMGGSRGNGKQMTLTGAVAKESEKMKFSAVGTIRSPGKAPMPAAPKVQTKISDWFADEALLKLRRKKATAKEKLELAMEAERLAEVDA
jgi:DNA polymerase elongation subunit (family B)